MFLTLRHMPGPQSFGLMLTGKNSILMLLKPYLIICLPHQVMLSRLICFVMLLMQLIWLHVKQSTTGVVIFLNGAPIKWYSKRQNTIESSTFGSEFNAIRIAAEMNDSICYKLRIFGIPIKGPTNTFCDNESVVRDSTLLRNTTLLHITRFGSVLLQCTLYSIWMWYLQLSWYADQVASSLQTYCKCMMWP